MKRETETFTPPPQQWLAASDFSDGSKEYIIDRVEMKTIAPNVEKAVVYFDNEPRGLVLNMSNTNTIAQNLESDDTDDWTGGKVELYATSILLKGKRVPCIRVKFKVSAQVDYND